MVVVVVVKVVRVLMVAPVEAVVMEVRGMGMGLRVRVIEVVEGGLGAVTGQPGVVEVQGVLDWMGLVMQQMPVFRDPMVVLV